MLEDKIASVAEVYLKKDEIEVLSMGTGKRPGSWQFPDTSPRRHH